ncbi:MAG: TlyA family RNA methyltransferase [Desulfobacterales bacterium]|nr:TlyA family RNA methyltransferase [Desulfobacterales bacterium]MDZ7596895.1 TlyA family RNA methyltransferase [Desulfobacterales bacterium]
MTSTKKRADLLMVARGLAATRQRARALIIAGKVLADDFPVTKPGSLLAEPVVLKLKGEALAYVSRGGLKLEAALEALDLKVAGKCCLDVGASTGGFTDCLLQRGARRVYAVDVGYGQLAWKLRGDPRVVVIERSNIRYLPPDRIPEAVELVTIDTSFISLQIVVPAALPFLRSQGDILALIKPQFEVGKGRVGKGGVVRDGALHQEVIARLTRFFEGLGLTATAVIPSPILGPKGNQEFIIHLVAP